MEHYRCMRDSVNLALIIVLLLAMPPVAQPRRECVVIYDMQANTTWQSDAAACANGTLRVSPDEQVDFLRRFYARQLPIKEEFMRIIEQSLTQTPVTIENARGVHKLTAAWPAGTVLNSKTGATTIANGESVSWLRSRRRSWLSRGRIIRRCSPNWTGSA